MEPVLKIGLAGFGSVTRQLIPAIATMPVAKLTAVAAPRQESRDQAAEKYGVETYASVEAMCESGNVDAVWVCTPNSMHAEHAITAAEHGKHVINEKPMAVTMEDADAIMEAVRRNGVRYVQGHSKLFDAPVRAMREVVSSGDLGRPIAIHTWEYKPWISGSPRRDEDVDTSRGGGVVFRQGPHQVDVIRGIGGGLVKSVRAIAGKWHPDFPKGDGDYSAFAEFEDGTAATMAFNGYGFFDITELTWGIGEGGQQRDLDALPGQAIDPRSLPKRQPFYGLTLVSCERGDIRQSPDGLYVYTKEGKREVPVESRGPGRPEIDELYAAIRDERPIFPDEQWGLASLEMVLAILQSSSDRREVGLSRQVACPF
jgi:phthalate 4,5-cis-dihydrodiol dehydrogenase